MKWSFSAAGQLTAVTDTNGNALSFAYQAGSLHTITNASGRVITLTYTGGYLSSVSDGTRTVSYTYDVSGNLSTVTDPAGAVTTYQYDIGHRLTDILTPGNAIDAGGHQSFTYDSQGRASTTTGLNRAHWMSFAYNTPTAGMTTVTDSKGAVSVFAYDQSGDITSITDPNGKTTNYGWTNGLKTSRTDQLGNVTTYAYTAGNLTQVTQPAPKPGDPQPVSTTPASK